MLSVPLENMCMGSCPHTGVFTPGDWAPSGGMTPREGEESSALGVLGLGGRIAAFSEASSGIGLSTSRI